MADVATVLTNEVESVARSNKLLLMSPGDQFGQIVVDIRGYIHANGSVAS